MSKMLYLNIIILFCASAVLAETPFLSIQKLKDEKDFKNARIVLVGESHLSGFSIDETYETLLAAAEGSGFDCLLLEIPKYIFQKSYTAYSSGASFEESVLEANKAFFSLPFFPGQKREIDWTSPVQREALDYRHKLLREARDRKLKLFAIDTDYRELNIPDPDRGSLEEKLEYNYITRNAFMAHEIKTLLQSGRCKKTLVSVGAAHLYGRYVLPESKRFAVTLQDLLSSVRGPVLTLRLLNQPMNKNEQDATYHYVVTP